MNGNSSYPLWIWSTWHWVSYRASVKFIHVEVNFMSPSQSESRIAILLSKLSLSWLPSMLFRNPLCCEFLFSFLTFEAQACPFGDISLHCFSYCTAAETELTELNFSGVSSMTVSLHIVSYIYAWTETLVCVCKDIFKLIGEWILYIIN